MICADCGANAGGFAEVGAGAVERIAAPTASGAAAAESLAALRAQSDALRCRRCGGPLVQRSDDNDTVVRERLKVYHRQTEPLVEYYRTRPTFRSIDGAQPPDRVAGDLAAAIESVAKGLRVGNAAPGGARR